MKKYALPVVACLTLGLAPFAPEPHIVGKIRWILGGTHGMTAIDWFDALLHGAPWLVLLYLLARDGLAKLRAK